MIITLSNKDIPDLPNFRLDDSGSITLHFKVVGANKSSNMPGLEGDETSYTLECDVEEMSTDKVTLNSALDKAASKEIRVKTQVSPAP